MTLKLNIGAEVQSEATVNFGFSQRAYDVEMTSLVRRHFNVKCWVVVNVLFLRMIHGV